jgi:hypothetical protein
VGNSMSAKPLAGSPPGSTTEPVRAVSRGRSEITTGASVQTQGELCNETQAGSGNRFPVRVDDPAPDLRRRNELNELESLADIQINLESQVPRGPDGARVLQAPRCDITATPIVQDENSSCYWNPEPDSSSHSINPRACEPVG